mmetsp:Transcript_17923/g.30492  ORF Transcript_17923/g.30492 Transcript_17923/m.30492 type:complete len:117 (+) Transcript_17923:27-377(+)
MSKYYPAFQTAGNLVFVSGQNAEQADGSISGDAYEQAKTSLEIIKGTLEKAGCTFKDVVKVNCFISEDADFEGLNKAYSEVFPNNDPTTPARSVGLGVAWQTKGSRIEIEMIANKS